MSLISRELGELLVDNGLISAEQLELVRKEKQKTGQSISQILTRLGLVTENQLMDTLELQYGVTYVALNKIKIEPRTIHLLPEELIRVHRVLPISQEDERLNLAMVNPDDADALLEIKTRLPSYQIKVMVCLEDDFERFVNFYFPSGQPLPVAPAPNQEEPVPPLQKSPAVSQSSPASQPTPDSQPAQTPTSDLDLPGKDADASDLGNFLLRLGILDIDQLFDALRSSLKTNKTLAETLVEKNWVTKEKVGELIKLMQSSSGSHAKTDPSSRVDGDLITKTDPATDKKQPGELAPGEENGSSYQETEDDIDFLNLFKQAPQTPVSLLAHQIITKAVEKKWSDVQIELRKDFVLVRYLDLGEVVDETHLDREFFAELVASYKLFAGLDPSLTTKPQDCRIPMSVLNRQIELRVTTIPEERQEMVGISIKYLDA